MPQFPKFFIFSLRSSFKPAFPQISYPAQSGDAIQIDQQEDPKELMNHESRSFHMSCIWACRCTQKIQSCPSHAFRRSHSHILCLIVTGEYSKAMKSILSPFLETPSIEKPQVKKPTIIEIIDSESDPEDPGPAFDPPVVSSDRLQRTSEVREVESPDVEIISILHPRPTPSIVIRGVSRDQNDAWMERHFGGCDIHTWEFDYSNSIARVYFRNQKHARRAFTASRKKQSSFVYSFSKDSHPHWSVMAARRSGPVNFRM